MNRRAEIDARRSLVGASVPRLNAKRLAAGRGRYTDDLRIPRLAHAAFLRSPYAHARIDGIDLAAARAYPGVIAAYEGRDLQAVCTSWTTRLATLPEHVSASQSALATERALWQGQPVAVVIAETRAIAEDALAHIVVDWHELEPIIDSSQAMAPGAALIHPELGTNIGFDRRLDAGPEPIEGARVLRRRLRFTRHTGVPLEARAIIADFDPTTRRLTLHHSHQAPHQMRAIFADCLGLDEADVRIVNPDVGGGFGIKLHAYDDEIAVAASAVLLCRPVKFGCDRLEAFVSDIHARGHEVNAAIMYSADGTIFGFELDDVVPVGAYSVFPRSSVLEGTQVLTQVGAPYATTSHRSRVRVVYQNLMGTASYRGVGQPIACCITEQLVDAAAHALGVDPAEFRRRNFRTVAQHGEQTITGITTGELSHRACLDLLLERMDYAALRREQTAARSNGRYLGIGLATFIEMTAPGSGIYGAGKVKISSADGCTLRLEPSGSVTCITSNCDQGQGTETAIRQLVAQALGVTLERVRIVLGDTAVTPVGGGAFASRGLTVGGEAALAAAETLRERLLAVAAAVCKRDPAGLILEDTAVRDRADGHALMGLDELGTLMHYSQHSIPAGVPIQPAVTVHETPKQAFLTANGVQASLVEVDIDTGMVRLLNHWVVEDCGRIINPLLADEQLRGGVVQGIGAALFEECRYDDRGQMLTGTLIDYLVPMAGEMPDIDIAHVETPVLGTRLGVKGLGEAGTNGAAAAVANAINDALRPLGAELTEQPYTPERILRALRKVI